LWRCYTHIFFGRKIRVRHFREGKELPILDQDNSYDFNFQETRSLPAEVTVLPGDDLLVECVYSTKEVDGVVFAGLATENEMCLAFIYYYPRIAISTCFSQLSPASIATTIGGSATFDFTDWSWKFTSPPEAAGYRIWEVFAYAEWDEWYLREPYQDIWRTGNYAPMCWQQADQEETHYQSNFWHVPVQDVDWESPYDEANMVCPAMTCGCPGLQQTALIMLITMCWLMCI